MNQKTTLSAIPVSTARAGEEACAWARVRRGLLISIGSGSLILSMTLIATIVRPEKLQTLGTAELMMVLGFLTLPVITLMCIRYDRSIVRSVMKTGCVDLPQCESICEPVCESLASVSTASLRIAHEAHDRGLSPVHHARLGHSVEAVPVLQIEHEKTPQDAA